MKTEAENERARELYKLNKATIRARRRELQAALSPEGLERRRAGGGELYQRDKVKLCARDRARLAAETPEQREERLAIARVKEAARRRAKGMKPRKEPEFLEPDPAIPDHYKLPSVEYI